MATRAPVAATPRRHKAYQDHGDEGGADTNQANHRKTAGLPIQTSRKPGEKFAPVNCASLNHGQ